MGPEQESFLNTTYEQSSAMDVAAGGGQASKFGRAG